MPKAFPARLHVILARDSPLAVVIRRGPSKSVCTLLWDRSDDTFRLGQWVKGRIYERRADLSPDGKYLIYFAMNGRWTSETKGAWTAISRVPYLKAISLLPKGDCWNGGGLFTASRKYWLNDPYEQHTTLRDSREVIRDRKFTPKHHYGGECPGVYYLRLQRDGWAYANNAPQEKARGIATFDKRLRDGWTLRKLAHAEVNADPGHGCYWDEHQLIHRPTGKFIPCPDWEWAELDARRLVWASKGRLYRGFFRDGQIDSQHCLHDFNEMKFGAIEAPY